VGTDTQKEHETYLSGILTKAISWPHSDTQI